MREWLKGLVRNIVEEIVHEVLRKRGLIPPNSPPPAS